MTIRTDLRVGDGQCGPVGVVAFAPGAIGGGQVTGEGRQRPTVRGDVVDHHGEAVVIVGGTDETRPDRQVDAEIEGLGGELTVG